MNTKRLMLVIAFLCFLLAAFGVAIPASLNLVAFGLALWVATAIF